MIEVNVLASSSKGNCYHISDGISPILIECGIKYREIQKRLNFNTSNIVGCLVSHEHGDHAKSMKDVLKAGIDVYSSKGTFEALRIKHHRAITVESKKQFRIGTWTVLPFDVQHDCAEPLGYLLVNQEGEKLLFATDTYYIKYKFNGITHLLVECNYSLDILEENVASGRIPQMLKKRVIRSHMSLENFKDFLLANDLSEVQEIHLLHLSDSNSDAERFKREVQELTGKVVIVP